jgi:hypothetical protein
MRFLLLISFFLISSLSLLSQNIQLHYDFRHTVDPGLNEKNFPAFSFEYFKDLDTSGTGSFLFKLDARLDGKNSNIGQVFTQISQTLRFWKPKPRLALNYSGGLGVTPASYGYYISNAFGVGIAYPFQWSGAWIAASLSFRVNFFDKPSYDPQLTLYFGKGFFNFRIFTDGSFVFWTENKNQGTESTMDLSGKKFAFFGDPKLWIRIRGGFSVGSKVNIFYNLIGKEGQIQFYPTIGTKYQF